MEGKFDVRISLEFPLYLRNLDGNLVSTYFGQICENTMSGSDLILPFMGRCICVVFASDVSGVICHRIVNYSLKNQTKNDKLQICQVTNLQTGPKTVGIDV